MGLIGLGTILVVVVLDCEWESELAPGSVFISLVLGYIVACPAIYRSLPLMAQHLHNPPAEVTLYSQPLTS